MERVLYGASTGVGDPSQNTEVIQESDLVVVF